MLSDSLGYLKQIILPVASVIGGASLTALGSTTIGAFNAGIYAANKVVSNQAIGTALPQSVCGDGTYWLSPNLADVAGSGSAYTFQPFFTIDLGIPVDIAAISLVNAANVCASSASYYTKQWKIEASNTVATSTNAGSGGYDLSGTVSLLMTGEMMQTTSDKWTVTQACSGNCRFRYVKFTALTWGQTSSTVADHSAGLNEIKFYTNKKCNLIPGLLVIVECGDISVQFFSYFFISLCFSQVQSVSLLEILF